MENGEDIENITNEAQQACFECIRQLRSYCKPGEDFLAISLMNDVVDGHNGTYSECSLVDSFAHVAALRPLLAASQHANRIDIELSVREEMLIHSHQVIRAGKKFPNERIANERIAYEEYEACFTKYLSRLTEIDEWFKEEEMPSKDELGFPFRKDDQIYLLATELPLLGDGIILRSALRYSSCLGKTDLLGRTVFQVGLYQGTSSDCEYYLDRYIDVPIIELKLEELDRLGVAAIHIAAMHGFDNIIRKLLQKWASVDKADFRKRTAMHYGAKSGKVDTIRTLLEGKGNYESKDDEGRTPLMLAAERGHSEVVQLLLENGADSTQVDKYHETPLILAAREGHSEIVQLLLEHGVDPMQANAHNSTPLLLAAQMNHFEVVELLLNHGAGPTQVDADAVDRTGRSPIFWAALYGYWKIVQVLLESRRTNPDREDKDGWSPCTIAIDRHHHDVAELLISWKTQASNKGGL